MPLQPQIILQGRPVRAAESFAEGLQTAQRFREGEQRLKANALRIGQAEREREFNEARRGLALIDRAETPELWDQIAQKVAPDLVGRFNDKENIRQVLQATVEAMDPRTPDVPKTMKLGNRIISLTPDGQGGFTVNTLAEEPAAPSQLERRAELAGLKPGTPEFQEFMLNNGRGPGQQFSVTLPDGTTVDLTQGGREMSKASANTVDKNILDSSDLLAGLKAIEGAFDPRFLELGTRFGASLAGWKDKLGSATPEDQQLIREYAAFRRRTLDALSQRLNALSGAAVSPQEFDRISKTLPNAGTGIFDGDSPAEFDAKLTDALEATRFEIMRQRIIREKGLGADALLGDRERIVAERIEQLEQQARAQGATDQGAIDAAVDIQIKSELGL